MTPHDAWHDDGTSYAWHDGMLPACDEGTTLDGTAMARRHQGLYRG